MRRGLLIRLIKIKYGNNGDTPMKYLLNANSRTIHNAWSTNGRCKIALIQDSNRVYFDSFKEAMAYLPKGKKNPAPCTFCLGKDYDAP